MQSDGTAVLRKENGFLFHIQSVAILVSGKALICKAFSSLETKATKELKKTKIAKTTAERRNLVFRKRFPVSVAGSPCPALGGIEMNAVQKNTGLGTPHPCTMN